MARTYHVFGDIEGKLDVLSRRVHQVRPQGSLQRGLLEGALLAVRCRLQR
jgi:hypothetical protein